MPEEWSHRSSPHWIGASKTGSPARHSTVESAQWANAASSASKHIEFQAKAKISDFSTPSYENRGLVRDTESQIKVRCAF